MLAGLFDPHASGDEIAEYTRQQRRAASAEAASIFLELDLDADVREVLPHVQTPSLVLHRRAIARAVQPRRELASLLPNARFVPLTATRTYPGATTSASCSGARGFLHADAAAATDEAHRSRPARRRCCGSLRPDEQRRSQRRSS